MDDIRRFGPAIRNSTEIFECFNAIFRLCSILSNHQAPSRDISVKFTSMDRVKHILSGGYWNSSKDRQGEWMRADEKVRQVLINDRTIQRHLGWTPPQKVVPGMICYFYIQNSIQSLYRVSPLHGLEEITLLRLGIIAGLSILLPPKYTQIS